MRNYRSFDHLSIFFYILGAASAVTGHAHRVWVGTPRAELNILFGSSQLVGLSFSFEMRAALVFLGIALGGVAEHTADTQGAA